MARFSFIQPRLFNQDDAGEYVGIPALFKRMELAGWIKPSVHQRKMKLYDKNKLDHCIDRLNSGEFPGE